MISKINRIKNLGIFADFSWPTGLSEFGRYNVIYGWNGSGKTTLASLFSILAGENLSGYPSVEYEIGDSGGIVKTSHSFPTKIRVFSRTYVENNVHTVTGRAKPIFILGEENKKIADAIVADEAALLEKRTQHTALEEEARRTSSRKDKVFSDIAKTIGLNTAGLATRNYRKPDAERDFAKLSAKLLLSDEDVTGYTRELQRQEKARLDWPGLPTFTVHGHQYDIISFVKHIAAEGAALCARTVNSMVISRLKENKEIAEWVERGVALHDAHASTICEFCSQALPSDRMAVLAAHFNDADRKLKEELDAVLKLGEQVEDGLKAAQPPDKANLYDELQASYQLSVSQFAMAKADLLAALAGLRSALQEKKAKTTEPCDLEVIPDGLPLANTVTTLLAELNKHNEKTLNFKSAKDLARQKLETHYLSTVFDEVAGLEVRVVELAAEKDRIQNGDQANGTLGISDLTERIRSNRATISSAHKGCEEINGALHTFLGRGELRFEVNEDGYALMRGDQEARNLSEGERAAIGLVHFIIHLKDQDFDPSKGIIVVDDPISSLDANSMFQAFAVVKNAVQDAQQVFIFTHNFDFLRLLINWMQHLPQRAYYMIRPIYLPNHPRTATIHVLDKLLKDHESEYHYLFKILHTFETDGTIESVYNIPNVARKVLDTFLMFRVPNSSSTYQKLVELRPYFDENKLTAIYKFTNDQSHITGKGFDPSLVDETQKNVRYLLEMIETVFPEHYRILVASVGA